MKNMTVSVEELMAQAFTAGRDPQSAEYKRGVLDLLRMRIEGDQLGLPYEPGTAQCDAYFAGQEEGKAIWHALQED